MSRKRIYSRPEGCAEGRVIGLGDGGVGACDVQESFGDGGRQGQAGPDLGGVCLADAARTFGGNHAVRCHGSSLPPERTESHPFRLTFRENCLRVFLSLNVQSQTRSD